MSSPQTDPTHFQNVADAVDADNSDLAGWHDDNVYSVVLDVGTGGRHTSLVFEQRVVDEVSPRRKDVGHAIKRAQPVVPARSACTHVCIGVSTMLQCALTTDSDVPPRERRTDPNVGDGERRSNEGMHARSQRKRKRKRKRNRKRTLEGCG